MNKELKEASSETSSFQFKQIFAPDLRFPLLICVLMQVAQQWSGINAIFFYSEMIFKSAGLDASAVQYAVLGTGIINVIATIIAVSYKFGCLTSFPSYVMSVKPTALDEAEHFLMVPL
jgi:hypothetical protein